MAAYSAGSAYLDIIPSFDGVQRAIQRELRKMESALGSEAGDQFGKSFEEKSTRAVDRALGTNKDAAEKSGREAGDKYAGRFADSMRKGISDVQKEIKALQVRLKDDEARAQLKALGTAFRALDRNVKIGMDPGASFRTLERLQAKVQDIQSDASNLELRTNAAQVTKALERVRAEIKSLSDEKVEVTPELQMGAFERLFKARMTALLQTIPEIKPGADMSEVEREIFKVRTELQALGDVRIGADISADEALAKAAFLKTVISGLGDREDVSLDLVFDTKAAAAELETFIGAVKAATSDDLTIEPKVDGSFGRTVRAQLEAALRDFEVHPDLVTGEIDQEAAALRLRLQELLDLHINGYLDAGDVVIKAGEIKALFEDLQHDRVDIEMTTNAAAVASQLGVITGLVKTIDDLDPEINIRVGGFERDLKARIKTALATLPPFDVEANTTPAEREIGRLRAALFALNDRKIGVDIRGSEALIQAEQIRRGLATVATDKTVDIHARSDAASAAAELLELRKVAKLVDGTKVEIKVDLDENGIRQRLDRLRGEGNQGGGAGANAFRTFSPIVLGVALALPAIAPLAGAAAGALALLAPIAIGAAAGLGVLALAFSGVGDAVTAMGNVQKNSAKDALAAQKTVATASRGLENAQRGVERAETSAARSGVDAARRVTDARQSAARDAERASKDVIDAVDSQADAEKDLVKAQQAVVRAQQAVDKAREQATRRMRDLSQQIKGGALDEREAVLNLAKAQTAYNSAVADPGATRTEREELLLDLRQQQLGLENIRISNSDLADEQAEANRSGVEGSQEVVTAQEAVASAQDSAADAAGRLQDAVTAVADAVAAQAETNAQGQQNIADAVEQQQQAQIDGAASVADAQQALIDAQANYADALYQTQVVGSASMQALNDAMGKLGPSGQAFATFLFGLQGQLSDLREIAAAGVLPGVQDAISQILEKNGPLIALFLGNVSAAIGGVFTQLGDLFTSPTWQGIFDTLAEYAPIFIDQFGKIGMNLLTFFGEVFVALAPYAKEFGDDLITLTGNLVDWFATFSESDTFTDFFDWFRENGGSIFGVILDLAGAVLNILISLEPLGQVVLGIVDNIARFIGAMDPDVLGTILTIILGLVVAFQLASGAATLLAGIALLFNPVILVVFIIGALITALVVLYTQSETARNIIDGVFSFLGDIISYWWENIVKPIFEFWGWELGIIWSVVQEVFGWISWAFGILGDELGWVYDHYIKPIWDAFSDALGDRGLKGVFRDAVDGIKNIWNEIKEAAAGPINFVIRTVLRDGLVHAFNWVVDTLHLPGGLHIDESQFNGIDSGQSGGGGYAAGGMVADQRAGGRVRGQYLSDTADNVYARLNPGEHVQPNKRVRQYGMDLFEAFRQGRIDPAAARSLMPGYASGGPVYQQIFAAVKGRFPRARMNDGFRPGAGDLHGAGLAVDLGEEGFAGGNGRPYLAAMNRDLYDRAGSTIAELIYDGEGDDRPDLKNGAALNYGAALAAQHHNHVHLAVRSLDAFLQAFGSGIGGLSATGTADTSGGLLGGIWDSVTGVFNGIKDSITAPIAQLLAQFGDNPLTQMISQVPGTLVGGMWDKVSDLVGGVARSIWNGATDLASSFVDFVTGGGDLQTESRLVGGTNRALNETAVRNVAARRGWDQGAQWTDLRNLIMSESGFDNTAQNPTSTAYGMFQFLNSTWAGYGGSKTSNPQLQAEYGLNYIAQRYGNPTSAWAFHRAHNYYSDGGPVEAEAPTLYDTGGWLPPGITTVLNATNKPEPILTSQQWNDMTSTVEAPTTGGRGIRDLHIHEVQADFGEAVSTINHWVKVYDNGGRYGGSDT